MTRAEPGESRRILVVDDDFPQRRVFSSLLSKSGYGVVASASAGAARAQLRDLRFDVALVDIVMPDMDGISLLKTLRADPATAGLPVVLMTGLRVPDTFARAASAGLGYCHIFQKNEPFVELESMLADAMRRGAGAPGVTAFRRGGLLIDRERGWASFTGMPIRGLVGKRLELLSVFAGATRPLTRRAIYEQLWTRGQSQDVFATTLRRLRQDLRAFPRLRVLFTPAGYVLTGC